MFESVECPKPAYIRLVGAGIAGRILREKESISKILLYNDPYYDKKGRMILSAAKRGFFGKDRRISDRRELYKNILEFDLVLAEKEEEGLVLSDGLEMLLADHPSFLAFLALGNDILKYREYGFPSRRSLEEAIASFCLGEKHIFGFVRNAMVWRIGDMKNEIHQNMHGDLYASQIDVSGKESVNLFGQEVFDTTKKVSEKKTIYAYQDWSQFLIATLKYAHAIGKEKMFEIVNWRDVLEETGAVGTATAEAMFGSGIGDWEIDFLVETPVLSATERLETFPLTLPNARKGLCLPYITQQKLIYLNESEEGNALEILRGTNLEDIKFLRSVEYHEQDLHHVLRATYKLFARDRTLLPIIMDKFLKQINS